MYRGLIAIVLGLLIVSNAQAHEIKTDGLTSVLLHMEPQDSPVVGEPATLYFSFDHKNNQFTVLDCNCRVVIKNSQDEVLLDQTLTTIEESFGENVYSTKYAFPARGIYFVSLTGNSKTNKFDEINLEYGIRVERTSTNQPPVDPKVKIDDFNTLYWIGISILIIGTAIYIILRQRKQKKDEKK
ncbi:MAG TPA: hypothetical protein VD998_00705 [Verrucomicrobiae bacterium]|nr:hypothetical protein [Verrucomicrobiae bacterium]